MPADIVHASTYSLPPDLVWRALTTSDALAAWLMANDFGEAKVGHKFRFTDRPRRPFWDGICNCEVVEADAPRSLALRWGIDAKDAATRVTWTLAPTAEGGTRLELRHSGLTGVLGWFMKKGMDQGWRRMVEASIPFVAEQMEKGRMPTREEVREVAKRC